MELKPINEINDKDLIRYPTGISGFDEMLGQDTDSGGQGFVPGQVSIFAGEPGAGKSTFMLQVANNMAQAGNRILYTSGEESLVQIKSRATRLKTLSSDVWCSDTINLDEFYKVVDKVNPKLIIIDSLQMMYSASHRGDAGSPAQMKSAVRALIKFAKENDKILIIICHTTKSGVIAGAMTLQFLVDANFRMYSDPDTGIRTVFIEKNRYGKSKVAWQAKMTADGLIDINKRERENTLLDRKTQPIKVITETKDTELSDINSVETIKLKYPDIKVVLSNHYLNKYAINSDVNWLYEKIYGKLEARLHKINSFEITLKVTKI